MMNFPNTLSSLRIILSPVFIILFLSGSDTNIQISFFVFTIAALTDWYDGWYARKYGFKTKWGRFLDPLADKILTSSALISFCVLNARNPQLWGNEEFIPISLLVAIIITRDIVLTVIRSYKELKGKEFRTSMISKVKTFIQMTYIFLVIGSDTAGITFKDSILGNKIYGFLYTDYNYYLLLLVTLLTVASGVAYFFESNTIADSKLA
jgi:CDP-diacylglycerol--glycerol-3-phosphate 3-phosphatidyltransferase